MTDVVLINPGAQRQIYSTLAETQTAIEPPTWCRMIAGWLRDRGYGVAIIDQEAMEISADEVAEKVDELAPRLVAIVVSGHQPSASTQQMVGAREVVDALPFYRNPPKIMVGNHPSALPRATLGLEAIKYVCDGEGPATIAGLLDGKSEVEIPGLVWGFSADMRTLNAPLIPIDELHGDVWDLLPMDRYRAHTWQCLDGSPRSPYASVYTSLGCIYKCSFCMINIFQHTNKYRKRTPRKVVDQIDALYVGYGVRTLKIADEMFVLAPKHYMAICEGLAALPYADELNIWAYARVDTIKAEHLPLMRRAGIRWLALGIESGSAHVRDGASKTLSSGDIRDAVKAIQATGINVLGNFIFGLPDDTLETMRATLDLAKSLDLEYANFYSAMAYPGSQLHRDADPKDLPANWSGYSQHSVDCRPLPTLTLSSADVLRFRDDAHHEFFEDPAFLDETLHRFGDAAVAQIRDMQATRLERELLA